MRRTIAIEDARKLLRTRAELMLRGATDRGIARAVASGELHRVRRGWFVSGSEWTALWPEGRHLLHIVAVASDARSLTPVFSHVSAAAVHGFPLYRLKPVRVEVRIADPHQVHSAPDVLRHEGPLDIGDITEVDGIRVTGIERTVVDVARTVSREAAVSIADASLRSAAVDRNVQDPDRAATWRDSVDAQLMDARGRPGIRQARWVANFADGRAQLPGESVSRLQLYRLGVRNLDLQVAVPSPDGGSFWVDFGFDDDNVFGEFDGIGKYTDEALRSGRTVEQVVLDEKQREDWIRGTTGRPVLRWGEKHIATSDALAHRLRGFGVSLPR